MTRNSIWILAALADISILLAAAVTTGYDHSAVFTGHHTIRGSKCRHPIPFGKTASGTPWTPKSEHLSQIL
jgi:hypothetical protein